ncbi:ABC transporter substrate-binding protein [Castellaniella defragrans]|uniref:Branched-chain amino acid transport system substrate-binding protein n=1 Tax=Castellaniella defragrans TaxID=75697 RepID=A0A7W9TN82_CASDE|nr:ABC transporter substrate-binding protein [Castellaniella defragrans]KAB0604465.1 ABC transporter substrate-binding protein [Castellaniella defragrans]MBB6083266.1 branched-chain amino acid transport system substrate-binding protein [Castellaniella defragrans]
MAHHRIFRILAVAAVVAPTAFLAAPATAADGVAKIGVFLPLTGENAENGQQIRKAVELYVNEYNQQKHAHKIELLVRDDRGEPKTATNIAREFAQDKDLIAAVGSFTSTAAMAAAPILDKAGIPQISPTSSHPDFTGLAKYAFRGTPTQSIEADRIADYVADKLGSKTAAIVYRQDDWGNSAAKVFRKSFEAKGGTIVAAEAVAPDTRDLRTLVTVLKEKNPDSVYVALHYASAAVLAQRMKAAGWNPKVITSTALYTHQLVELAGNDAVENWHVPAFFFAESKEPVVQNFVAAYKKAYDQTPNAFGAVGYDSIAMIGTALDDVPGSGTEGRKALGDKLFEVQVRGTTGQMKFDANGDIDKTITWLEIKGGKFVQAP